MVSLSGSDQSRSQSRPWSGTSVGRIIRLICSMLWRSGLRPPWQQKIFSSTMAATGRQLKQSVNVFHSLILYRRLPDTIYILYARKYQVATYIRRRIHKFCWWMHTHGCHVTGKNFPGILSTKRIMSNWLSSLLTASVCVYLVCKQKTDGLQRLLASIYVISYKARKMYKQTLSWFLLNLPKKR